MVIQIWKYAQFFKFDKCDLLYQHIELKFTLKMVENYYSMLEAEASRSLPWWLRREKVTTSISISLGSLDNLIFSILGDAKCGRSKMQHNIICALGLQLFRGQGVSPLHTEKLTLYWVSYADSVYTTQLKSTFRMCWLASSEVISRVLLTSEQPQRNKMTCVGILSQINLYSLRR